jgi:exonuclease III
MSEFVSWLVWNVRGLNSLARCDSIYQIVLLSGASVVCFQETKLQVVSREVVDRCMGRDFDQFFFLPADGTRGGILLESWSQSMSLQKKEASIHFCTHM